MKEKQYPWFKVANNIMSDAKIMRLAPSDRWYFVCLMAMTNDGTLLEPDDLRDELMMHIMQLTVEELAGLKARLMRLRLIGDDWVPVKWDHHQVARDRTGAERQARFRERQAEAKQAAESAISNANSDGRDVTDTVTRDVTRDVTEAVTRDVTLPEEEVEEEVRPSQSDRVRDSFEAFWLRYPRKDGKKNALALFRRLSSDERKAMLADDPVARFKGRERNYIPAGDQYVKRQLWQDEITSGGKREILI